MPVSRRRISSVTACARSGLSITRGVSRTSSSVRALVLFLVLNRAPMIGIDDRIGTPLRLRVGVVRDQASERNGLPVLNRHGADWRR